MKLAINQPGDVFEQEADRVSEQVMRMPAPQLQRTCACGGGCPTCQTKEPGQEHVRLQTKRIGSSNLGQTEAPPIVGEVLSSSGQPLDSATRTFMEPRFGHDFSRVRVHTDTRANQSAQKVNALAYTVGENIVFGAGQPAPGTQEGRRLIAHELAHVVQQSGSSEPTRPSGAGRIAVVQRTGAPLLQGFWVTREPAGGCGVCYKEVFPQAPAAAAGRMAHGVIQRAFEGQLSSSLYRLPEFPYSSPTDDSGRLDLVVATPTGLKIGEIKPANKEGEEAGVKKLDWYRTTLQATYPNSTIEMLDIRAPGPGLEMPDPLAPASGCQAQTLGVTAMRPGLYGYWCAPPFSVARRQCSCVPGSGGTDTTEIEMVQTALDALAVSARLAGNVEVAIRLEEIVSAIAAGIMKAAQAVEAAEDVGFFGLRALILLEVVD